MYFRPRLRHRCQPVPGKLAQFEMRNAAPNMTRTALDAIPKRVGEFRGGGFIVSATDNGEVAVAPEDDLLAYVICTFDAPGDALDVAKQLAKVLSWSNAHTATR